MAALPLIVFDVNETLLDLETMEPTFRRIFGDRAAMRLWFDDMILYSAALTVAGCYVPFTDIGSAVMKMLADTRGIRISDADRKELTDKFSTMPPHAEVPAALRKLRAAGFRLFTLTDNLLEVQTRQLEHGGIVDLFERRFSADGVKHHKPSREAYGYVEKELGVKPSQLCLIACHTWDTLGAVAAGWQAALIKRDGNDLLGVGPQPQFVGDDLNDVADQLIARHRN
ncbi:MAG: haloacid dehalogenase type II [Bradyrhizobium sp.]